MKQEEQAKNMPEKKYKVGYCTVALWGNTSKEGKEYFMATIDRSYKDEKSGEIKSTNSLRMTDIPDIILALQFAAMENNVKLVKKE